MFIGHFAIGLGAKRAAPRASLTVLLTAALFLDVLWPIFLWLGLERVQIVPGDTAFTPLRFEHYPWSHSLVMALAWSVLFALVYRSLTGYRAGALWVGIAVFSHWALDFLSHRPDLPLIPGGGPKAGLGLWNTVTGTAVVEIALFVIGLALYLRTTRAKGAWGQVSLWSLVAMLAFLYSGTVQQKPPPNLTALKVVSTAMLFVFIPWFVWIDRTRVLRVPAPAPA